MYLIFSLFSREVSSLFFLHRLAFPCDTRARAPTFPLYLFYTLRVRFKKKTEKTMSYAYLFKYIIIGDTGKRFIGKAKEAQTVTLKRFEIRKKMTDSFTLSLSLSLYVQQAWANRACCCSLPISGFSACTI
jgi:hypothetical protein